MTTVNCRPWASSIVECARSGAEPDARLRQHLAACPQCAERWDDECVLSAQLRIIRAVTAVRPPSPAERERAIRSFPLPRNPVWRARTAWALSAAAMVAMVFGLALVWRNGRAAAPHIVSLALPAPSPELLADEDGFVAFPYAPPLAAGEFVRVLRTEMQTAALAHMGIFAGTGTTRSVPAEVLVGEDGLPRAVRIPRETELEIFETGSL